MTNYALRSMPPRKTSRIQKTREHRRRVVLPARLRHGPAWSDACILNISSRGLMIHTGRQIAKGTKVEVRRGDHVIAARVAWRDGARAGLQAEDRVPLEALMTFVQSPAFQLVAATGERRKKARSDERTRLRGSLIKFAGVVIIAASLAGTGPTMVDAAFSRSMDLVVAALAN